MFTVKRKYLQIREITLNSFLQELCPYLDLEFLVKKQLQPSITLFAALVSILFEHLKFNLFLIKQHIHCHL